MRGDGFDGSCDFFESFTGAVSTWSFALMEVKTDDHFGKVELLLMLSNNWAARFDSLQMLQEEAVILQIFTFQISPL
jgi:hypothetical protein